MLNEVKIMILDNKLDEIPSFSTEGSAGLDLRASIESKIIIEKLGELISTGDINETLDGGKLLVLFRSVGISIRMENKINVEKDGKFISIADKFKKTTNDDEL